MSLTNLSDSFKVRMIIVAMAVALFMAVGIPLLGKPTRAPNWVRPHNAYVTLEIPAVEYDYVRCTAQRMTPGQKGTYVKAWEWGYSPHDTERLVHFYIDFDFMDFSCVGTPRMEGLRYTLDFGGRYAEKESKSEEKERTP